MSNQIWRQENGYKNPTTIAQKRKVSESCTNFSQINTTTFLSLNVILTLYIGKVFIVFEDRVFLGYFNSLFINVSPIFLAMGIFRAVIRKMFC